ncbi:MAG: hypothetical protein ACRC46_01260 [Thermoguttaceae bacterium]
MVSEPFSLKWSGMTIYSPKTEHLAGKAFRTIPIFAELRPYLEEVWDATQEGGDDYVFPLEHFTFSHTHRVGSSSCIRLA